MNRMKQLIYTFPKDATTSTGALFWSAPKRFPKPLEFNSKDASCISFVISAAILRAETYGIDIPDWASKTDKVADVIDQIKLPQFQPKQGVKIVTDEKATTLNASSSDDSMVIEQLIKALDAGVHNLAPGFRMNPVQFEKVRFCPNALMNLFFLLDGRLSVEVGVGLVAKWFHLVKYIVQRLGEG